MKFTLPKVLTQYGIIKTYENTKTLLIEPFVIDVRFKVQLILRTEVYLLHSIMLILIIVRVKSFGIYHFEYTKELNQDFESF